jgi:hypothetical protein
MRRNASVEERAAKVLVLHRQGFPPFKISKRVDMSSADVRAILADAGVKLNEPPAQPARNCSVWESDDPERLRNAIVQRAAAGARVRLAQLEQEKHHV